MGGIIVERGWLTRLICSLSSRKLSCGYMYCSYSWHKPLSKRQIVRDKLFVLLKRTRQGWEFTLSLIRSFPQNRSFLRATVSDSLFKKSDVNDSVVIRANRSIKKFVFFLCFWQFFPLLCLRANHSRRSSLIRSFLKSDMRDSLRSLRTKERRERFDLFHERIALLLTKIEQIARKTLGRCIPWFVPGIIRFHCAVNNVSTVFH